MLKKKTNEIIRYRLHRNRRITGYFILGIALIIFGLFCMRQYKNDVVEAAAQSVGITQPAVIWQTLPGTTIDSENDVHFSALNRQIVNQDGSGGQSNPPVNVGGPHLEITGDFKLAFDMSELEGGSSTVRLYQSVPVIYDEWRLEPASLSVTVNGDKLTVNAWDGKRENAKLSRSFTIIANSTHILELKREGKKLKVLVDGKQVTAVSFKKLFDSNKLWFGAESSGDGWKLGRLTLFGRAQVVKALDSKTVSVDDSLGTLALKARGGLRIGAAISLYPLMTDQSYRDIALNHFTQWTPENEMKAQFIHPAKDTYAFQDADLLVDTALKNNISIHGHALVFGEANAQWMQQTPKLELSQVMKDHITTVMTHFKGKVTEWDVVNEPLDDYEGNQDGLRRSIWYNAMGRGFMAEAFNAAHAADPTAKLYINEFGLEEDGDRWTTFLNLIKELKAANVPVDGVGFQAHAYDPGDEIDTAVLRRHIQQLASIGVVSRISEIDVHGDDINLQASQYGGVAGACRLEPSCTSFSTWGISDKYGSTTSIRTYPPEYGDGLLWDSTFNAKNAFVSVQNALK